MASTDLIPKLRRFAILTLICLAVSAPLGILGARSIASLGDTRRQLRSERRGVADLRIFVPLTFDADTLRTARARGRVSHGRLRIVQQRVLAEAATALAAKTPLRIAAAGCRPFATWIDRERAIERRTLVVALADRGDLVEDVACYTRAIATYSGLANETDPVTYDFTLIAAMSGPGLAGRVATATALFEDVAASGFRRNIVRAAGAIAYVTRNRENIADAVSEIGEPGVRAVAERADTAEVRFESGLAAALEPAAWSTRSAARIEALAARADGADRSLIAVALDALDRRLALADAALGARERWTIATELGGIVFTMVVVILAAREMSRRHTRAVAYLALERDALQAQLRATEMQRSLSLGDGQLRAIFDTADVGLAIVARTNTIAQSNDSYAAMRARMTGLDALTIARCADILAGNATRTDGEHVFELPGGHAAHVTLSLAGVYESGVCHRVVATVTDVSEARRLQYTLREASLRDPLTGLANRRAFEDTLAALCNDDRPPFTLLYLDLDRFKPINDTYGHAVGDTVLRIVAARIRAAVASDDVTARLGGDEFAIVLHDVGEPADVERAMTRIAAHVEQPVIIDTTTIDVAISVGASFVAGDEPRSAARLLAYADRAMYAAKRLRYGAAPDGQETIAARNDG